MIIKVLLFLERIVLLFYTHCPVFRTNKLGTLRCCTLQYWHAILNNTCAFATARNVRTPDNIKFRPGRRTGSTIFMFGHITTNYNNRVSAQCVTVWRNGPGSTVVNGQLLCSNAIILREKKNNSYNDNSNNNSEKLYNSVRSKCLPSPLLAAADKTCRNFCYQPICMCVFLFYYY